MKFAAHTLFNETTMAGTTLVTSQIVDARFMYLGGFVYKATGATPAGTLTFQGSLDETNPTTWVTIGSAATVAATLPVATKEDALPYSWIRATYLPANGVGTLTAKLVLKG